jgi:hypothetical protein
MDQSMLAKVAALRDEAFATFKALDDAVVSLGGKSKSESAQRSTAGSEIVDAIRERTRRRLSMAAAAEAILRERGTPMTRNELMEALPSKGATIGGNNPEVNFTSSMSKSGTFDSFRHGDSYYWWLRGKPLPANWQEAPDLPLQERSDASSFGNQKGGEAHATAT